MGANNSREYFVRKLENIRLIETNNYKDFEKSQEKYKERLDFYNKQKDLIGTKIRMLEVYQDLWENINLEVNGQAFMNEEIWNNIIFNTIKYDKFIQELNELDYDKKLKMELDNKTRKEVWEKRQEVILSVRNDVNYLNSVYNKMHGELHERTLSQRKCIEDHIKYLQSKYEKIDEKKKEYRSIFHEIKKDMGERGNKISRQKLSDYKVSLITKLNYIDNFEGEKYDIAR